MDQAQRPQGRSYQGVVRTERTFARFTLGQRWEHLAVMVTFTVLLLTGLPQKYFASWGHDILATPQSILLVRRIHHIAAIGLILEVIYHLGRALYLLARRRLSGDIFPNWQDVRDAWQMARYLLYLTHKKPAYSKYNFEQKFTYWFLFFAIGVMIFSGLILWFPYWWTHLLPGGIIPAAQLAHSSEAIAAVLFILIWHIYHVHLERVNLSIFTGHLNEADMRRYHGLEYQRLTGVAAGEEAAPGLGSAGEPPLQGEESL